MSSSGIDSEVESYWPVLEALGLQLLLLIQQTLSEPRSQ
jgi:hypothetical protein